MSDVVFYEAFEEEQQALKRYLPSEIHADFIRETIQETDARQAPASLVCIRTQSVVPVAWAVQMKGLLTRSTGYDHLVEYRLKGGRKIAYGYLPAYCSRAVAEQAMLMLLALSRKLPRQMNQMKLFCRDGLMGRELFGKRLLVVGIGRIGRECVSIAKGLGMKVKGVDLEKREEDVDYVPLDQGLRWADAVICSLPLTSATRDLLNYAAFSLSRPGLLFVNVGRGEVSPLGDMQLALSQGLLAGAALDVYPQEQETATALRREGRQAEIFKTLERMMKEHNVLFTPHNAFNTEESVERKAQQTIESVVSFLKKGFFVDGIPTKSE
ncbi:MAG TPA: NAD(P)-dependent oxidoreductase [Candidatus Bathyarchaeia archaeon]|nr:NAD(P)-dependent oxidoreductase [Candidatus Bathyarchaeia archaeon]